MRIDKPQAKWIKYAVMRFLRSVVGWTLRNVRRNEELTFARYFRWKVFYTLLTGTADIRWISTDLIKYVPQIYLQMQGKQGK